MEDFARSHKLNNADCVHRHTNTSKARANPDLQFSWTKVVAAVDNQGLAKFNGIHFESREKVQRRQPAGGAAAADVVARGFNPCDVFMVEKIKAFCKELKLTIATEDESLSQTKIRSIGLRITIGIATHRIKTIIAAGSVQPRANSFDQRP